MKTQALPSSPASFLPSSSRTSVMSTLAPSATRRRASAAPCPRAPPLTITTLPSNRAMFVSSQVAALQHLRKLSWPAGVAERQLRRLSLCRHGAVHRHFGAADVARLVGQKEEHEARYLVGGSCALHRHDLLPLGALLRRAEVQHIG